MSERSYVLSIRITPQLKNQIDQLAKAQGKPRSFLVEKAIKRYVQEESWQIQAISSALEKVEAKSSQLVDHEAVKKRLIS